MSSNDNSDPFVAATTSSHHEAHDTETKLRQQIAELQAQLARLNAPQLSSPKSLYEMLEYHLPSLIDVWNKASCESHGAEFEEDEITPAIPCYVLGSPDNADLSRRFPNSDVIRSSSAPRAIIAHASGSYEKAFRKAIRFEVLGLLETSSQEPNWTVSTTIPFFGGWEALTPYRLGESKNLMQEVADKDQARWDAAKLDLGVQGNSVTVEAFWGIIRSWFSSKDWLSLYRTQSRTLLAWDGRSVDDKDDREILETIESQLFDITKYYGNSELMTVITYGEGYYGTITLLRVTLDAKRPIARLIMNLGTMRDRVPKAILKAMHVKHQIKLVSKGGEIKFMQDGAQSYPSMVSAQTITTIDGRKSSTLWTMGDGWRGALGIMHDPNEEKDGLVATIPQMIALLHLKGSALYDLHSTQAFTFSSPDVQTTPQSDHTVSRTIKIETGPKGHGHSGKKVTVNVLFPSDSEWAKERIIWA